MVTRSNVTLMIMYEDESTDVRFSNDTRLHLSTCGSEFVLEIAPDPSAHPLQRPEKIRQRTRFAISGYKDLMIGALEFRNRYATRPYLPEELISSQNNKRLYCIDSTVEWPELRFGKAERGPKGETMVTSEDGRASLLLSASGEDFTVEFTCSLSQTPNQNKSSLSREPGGQLPRQYLRPKKQKSSTSNQQLSAEEIRHGEGQKLRLKEKEESASSPHTKSDELYLSTRVIQHHSCSCVPSMWLYPLSLARHFWTNCQSKASVETRSDELVEPAQIEKTSVDGTSVMNRKSCLPEALPLTCTSPHRHRWTCKDSLSKGCKDQALDLPTELVKVVWCHGVIYRIIEGAIPVIEVSPEDGSVIRSNGVLANYFTHYRPEPGSGEVKEITYHVNSLPPDISGNIYSVSSTVTRASRILTCHNQARHSLKLPATPSCLEQDNISSKPTVVGQDAYNSVCGHTTTTESVHNRPSLVAAELEKIQRFKFLLDSSSLLQPQTDSPGLGAGGYKHQDTQCEPLTENSIAEALHKTSKTIQDIEALISVTTLHGNCLT